MRVVDLSIRRPVTVFIFAVAAVLFGVVAFRQLPVDLLPEITYPSLTVRTTYEGAAPAEVENLITRPIENAVGVVNNVVRVVSSSRPDTSEVTLEFAWGTNMDFASLDVRERLDVVRLPLEASSPVLLRYDPSLDPVLRIGLVGDLDLIRARLLAEQEVKRALERVEGVAAAVVSGGLEEEIQVELDEHKLTSVGLDAQRVVDRLRQENINLTGGRLQEGQTEYLVRTVNELLRPEDLRSIVLQRSGGAVLRLSDVARIRRGAKEREVITRIDGRESVEIAIYKEGGTNTVTVVDRVLSQLDGLEKDLERADPSLQLIAVSDQARYIRDSVSSVVSSAIVGGSLAILILFVFLRSVKNTLIIGISIPVSVLATFFLMYLGHITLNIMSLGGLTLGVGLLVDNSIVVLEAIQRAREAGHSIVESARIGASQVSRAVTASTITTVCVFAPIVFVEGIAGQLFGDQALTVTFSLLVSLVVALTVIPMLASRGMPEAEPEEETPRPAPKTALGRFAASIVGAIKAAVFLVTVHLVRALVALVRAAGRVLGWLLNPLLTAFDYGLRALAAAYARSLEVVLTHSVPFILCGLILLAGSLTLLGGLGVELVPELVQGEFYVDAELPPGARLEVTDRRLQQVARVADGLPQVDRVYQVSGASFEQGGAAGELRENIGQVVVKVQQPTSKKLEDAMMEQLRTEIDRVNASYETASVGDLPPPGESPNRLAYRFGRPSYFSFRTPIEVEIRGFNLDLLQQIGDEVSQRMATIPGLTDVKASTEGGNPELQIRFDRERLAALGYTISEIGNLVRSKIQGDIATDIQREDRTIDIRMRNQERYRDSVKDLRNLNIARGDVAQPLSAVADIVETEGPAEIRRSNGSRIVSITANLRGRDLGSVSGDISSMLEDMKLPPGMEWSIGGQRQEMETSFSSMRLAILLAVFMVYLVMASQFESLLHPLVILFAVPFSAIGAILVLWLTSTTVSIVVLIGAILLAGIVVNNAIILVDYTNQLRQEGMAKLDALREAGRVRLRPILMTTSTTVLGLLPMAFGLGQGNELRAPMAITVVGGLVVSTLLTLLLIPAIYNVLDRRA